MAASDLLDIVFGIEHAAVRDVFGVEDAHGKPSGSRAL